MKRVKSNDPRKPVIMRAFREAHQNHGASKVVDVIDLGEGKFQATLHKHIGNKKYERLGVFQITVDEFRAVMRAEANRVLGLDSDETQELVNLYCLRPYGGC